MNDMTVEGDYDAARNIARAVDGSGEPEDTNSTSGLMTRLNVGGYSSSSSAVALRKRTLKTEDKA